jgi:serine/threonine protein kinase
LLTTLVSGAATAWDVASPATADQAGDPHAGDRAGGDDAAFECRLCGLVAESKPLPCCNGDVGLAALPRRLGVKFIVQRRLGAGGMGVVYLARDIGLERDVALKTLPDLREGTVARLKDEARAMAAMNHESLATIYGLELWRRTPVLVVEYFPGGTLARRLDIEPLLPSAAVGLGLRLAGALTYMHARGMLHRDLKPSNIAFTATGAPKLLDFGLATLIEPRMKDVVQPERLAHHGAIAGTPAYFPPEARLGATPDPAFDLWALSLVMLEAIAGRRPSLTDDRGHAIHRAVAVSVAGARQDAGALTPFFERALAFEPRSRFATALEMQSALDTLSRVVGDPGV